jgi:hypothetical protein
LPTVPRFTRRCEREDHPKLSAGIADGLIRKVRGRIDSNALETGDRYLAVPVPKMFTEHQGDFRAVTWFDESMDVVWICAAGTHDIYDTAERLHESDRLLPTREDYAAHEAQSLAEESRRAGPDCARLRQLAKETGSAWGNVLGVPFVVLSHDESLYELRFPQETPVAAVLVLAGAMFPDNVEIEWLVPERDFDGVLRQGIVVLVR